jgi:antagonist of KipI
VSIAVVEPGALTSVQDVPGRGAWRHVGVPVGGAADAWAARLANRLVGNDEGAAVLEMTLVGPTLRFDAPALVALAGGLHARLGGFSVPRNLSLPVRPGAILEVEGNDGLRGYLAVAGGIDVPDVLGSRATDLRSRFGGHRGRALQAGDRLESGAAPDARRRRWTGTRHAGPIRIVPGPDAEALPVRVLEEAQWAVAPEADRTGIRLDGSRIAAATKEVPSMGLPLGAIQVPGDGRPIVMLADRPVTGGYPVPAVVIGADIGRVAQLRPGDALSFVSVRLEEAVEADRQATEELAAIELLGEPDDDELSWVGSLD